MKKPTQDLVEEHGGIILMLKIIGFSPIREQGRVEHVHTSFRTEGPRDTPRQRLIQCCEHEYRGLPVHQDDHYFLT